MSKLHKWLLKSPISVVLSPFTQIKIALTMVLVLIANLIFGSPLHGILEIIELGLIYALAMVLGKHLRWLGYLFSSFATFLIIAQEWVKVYAGSYTTKVMLDNLANIHALGPALPKYIAIAVLVVVISFLPIKFNRYPKVLTRFAILAIGIVFFGGALATNRVTALIGTYNLAQDYRAAAKTAAELDQSNKNKAKLASSFAKTSVGNGINIGMKKPNVIVIFAEGTSRKVIEETQSKYPNLMPNALKFGQESLNFTNYYNHTAPTYKGLRGQLFSAFQYYEGYEGTKNAAQIKARLNTPLIGIPQILRQNGYASTFINPEPNHKQFTPYLNQLGFDQVVSGKKSQWTGSGSSAFLSDKENFNLLFDEATQMNAQDKPFFLGTYTLQTHNSWNVLDNPYGDGKNAVLNKFHNFDTVFGDFLKKFKASGLSKNTILILTTDHASYSSPDYASTMDDTRTAFASTIPLMIYYPGVKARDINVAGRNSLGLAPTILDMLNIQKTKNYFLGTSLFTNQPTKYEYTTEIGQDFYTTRANAVQAFPADESALKNQILKFDSFSLDVK